MFLNFSQQQPRTGIERMEAGEGRAQTLSRVPRNHCKTIRHRPRRSTRLVRQGRAPVS